MEPLSEGTHLIHIGPQKTGSTALQAAMHRARSTMAEHGVRYPGPGPRPREAAEVGLGFRRLDGKPKQDDRAWRRLLKQVNDPAYARVCVSLEAFGRATDEQIEKIVGELGGERPHVVAVARRYDTLMPSQWQQRIKSQMRLSYDEWLEIVLGDDHEEPRWRNLWVPHDTVSLVRRWTDVVGVDNFTLIVGDERDRDRLPRTFEELLALPTGTIDLSGGRRNQSLTYTQVELLRRVNVVFHERGWKHADYHDLVRRGLIPRLLELDAPESEPRIPPLTSWARGRLAEISDQRIDALRELSVRIVGDLDVLRVSADSGTDELPPPPETVSLDSATRAIEGMARASIRDRRAERRSKKQSADGEAKPGKKGKKGKKKGGRASA